jgi:hypothetical protein
VHRFGLARIRKSAPSRCQFPFRPTRPLSFVVGVVLTVRSLHVLGLGYWSLASTYVILLSEFAAVVLAVVAVSVHTQGSASDLHETCLWAASRTGLIGFTWSVWYNWRTTRSLPVAISVTVLQLITGGLIVLIFLLRSRPPEKNRAD